ALLPGMRLFGEFVCGCHELLRRLRFIGHHVENLVEWFDTFHIGYDTANSNEFQRRWLWDQEKRQQCAFVRIAQKNIRMRLRTAINVLYRGIVSVCSLKKR